VVFQPNTQLQPTLPLLAFTLLLAGGGVGRERRPGGESGAARLNHACWAAQNRQKEELDFGQSEIPRLEAEVKMHFQK